MKNPLKRCIIVFIMSTALFSGCAGQEPPLRIGTNQWAGYEPLYLARSLGYFDGTPIMLAEYLSATDVMNAFRNESIEAAAMTLDEALFLLEDNFDLKVILVCDYSKGADALVARPGIKDLGGLKGKRIGIDSMASGAYILSRALDAGKLRPSDVEIISLSPGVHETAYKTGSVDAVVTFEPALTKIVEAGGKKIFDSSMIPGEILDVLIMRADVLKNRPEVARDVVKSWFSALDYLRKNPEDAAERMARRSHISGEQFLKSLDGLHFPDFDENRNLLAAAPPGMLKPVERLINIMFENKLIRKKIDPASVADAAALTGAKQ